MNGENDLVNQWTKHESKPCIGYAELYQTTVTNLLCVCDNNVNNLFVLAMGIRGYRVSRSNSGRPTLLPLDPVDLDGSENSHETASPPDDTSKTLFGSDTVEQAGNDRSNGTTSGSNGRSKTVDLAQHRRLGSGFLEENKNNRIGQDGKDIPNRKAEVYTRAEKIFRQGS